MKKRYRSRERCKRLKGKVGGTCRGFAGGSITQGSELFSLDSPDGSYLTVLFLNCPGREIGIEQTCLFSLLRVQKLLTGGPVQILFILSQTMGVREGRRWVPWESRRCRRKNCATTLGNRKPRVSAIFSQLYLRDRLKPL